MENFLNASLNHLHQVNGLPPPPALLAPIGQTLLQLMTPANLGKSFEVSELPHSSAIGSQWMTENDSKEEKEADATILKVLSDIAAEEMNKEDPLVAIANDPDGRAISAGISAEHPHHSTLQVPEDPAPATSKGSPAADLAPAPATSEGSPAPATSEGSPTPATSEGSPAPAPATSEGSPAPAPAPAPAPDDPLHNPVISAPSNTNEKEVEC